MTDANRSVMGITRRYRMIITLDRSEYSDVVLEHALDQAARHEAPDLHVLTVVETEAELEAAKLWLAERVLEGLDAFRSGRVGWRTRLHVRAGNAVEEIVSLAEEVDADLLVIGHYGVHHKRYSSADRVMAGVSCPVLVVGLSGRELEGEPTCEACAAIRTESDGERWFCAKHAAPGRLQLSALLPWSGPLSHGGPLW